MIFTYPRRSIFIHIPKTGGNTVSQQLVQRSWSEDSIFQASNLQDGYDRFDLKGRFTQGKHMSLSDYLRCAPELAGLPVLTVVRKPFERLVSFYFSPHRHLKQKSDGTICFSGHIEFHEDEFLRLVTRLRPAASYLNRADSEVNRQSLLHEIQSGSINVMRTESLERDFEAYFGIALSIERRNVSAADPRLKQLVLQSDRLRNEVESSSHGIDLDCFY